MTAICRLVAALALAACGWTCRGADRGSAGTASAAADRSAEASPSASNPAASASGGSAMPHGDHNPHHGGVVFMKGSDLHYEVVLDPTGRAHAIYFTDAVREDLPASIASNVALTIKRRGAPEERIAMRIDDAGESWIGSGRAVEDPSHTEARIDFAIRGEPYWIDVPFSK